MNTDNAKNIFASNTESQKIEYQIKDYSKDSNDSDGQKDGQITKKTLYKKLDFEVISQRVSVPEEEKKEDLCLLLSQDSFSDQDELRDEVADDLYNTPHFADLWQEDAQDLQPAASLQIELDFQNFSAIQQTSDKINLTLQSIDRDERSSENSFQQYDGSFAPVVHFRKSVEFSWIATDDQNDIEIKFEASIIQQNLQDQIQDLQKICIGKKMEQSDLFQKHQLPDLRQNDDTDNSSVEGSSCKSNAKRNFTNFQEAATSKKIGYDWQLACHDLDISDDEDY